MPEPKCLDAEKYDCDACACFECIRKHTKVNWANGPENKKNDRKILLKKNSIRYYFYSEIWMISFAYENTNIRTKKMISSSNSNPKFERTESFINISDSALIAVAWRSKRNWKQRRWRKKKTKLETRKRRAECLFSLNFEWACITSKSRAKNAEIYHVLRSPNSHNIIMDTWEIKTNKICIKYRIVSWFGLGFVFIPKCT